MFYGNVNNVQQDKALEFFSHLFSYFSESYFLAIDTCF